MHQSNAAHVPYLALKGLMNLNEGCGENAVTKSP